jgi:hypothetical protein
MEYEAAAEAPAQGWIDCHSHQFPAGLQAKAIDVDGIKYMPGVYESGVPNEDWARQFYNEVGGEG